MADNVKYPIVPEQINYLERAKFEIVTVDNIDYIAVRTNVRGELTPQGLTVGGLITYPALTAISWLPIPTTPLANRNSIFIQNQSSTETLWLQFDNAATLLKGIRVKPGGTYSTNVRDTIILYGCVTTANSDVMVSEQA
jgi:hypothetical protein